MPFDPESAACFLDAAHANRQDYQNLPEGVAPTTLAQAYAAQEALARLWAPRLGAVAGLKIATTTKVMQELMGIDQPCGGIIFESRVYRSPALRPLGAYTHLMVECELAVRLAADLSGNASGYSRDTVRAAVGEVMAAFELIEDRNAHYKSTNALSLIADNAWNAGVVLGPSRPICPDMDLDAMEGQLTISGDGARHTGRTDDPLGALAWIANLAVSRGRPLRAGQIVITGSVIATLPIAADQTFAFTLTGLDEVVLTATP